MTRHVETHAPRLPDLADMVAIASGSAGEVGRWAAHLARAALPCAVARPYSSPDSAELWVGLADADLARVLLGIRW